MSFSSEAKNLFADSLLEDDADCTRQKEDGE